MTDGEVAAAMSGHAPKKGYTDDEVAALMAGSHTSPAQQHAMTHQPGEGASQEGIGSSHEGEMSYGDRSLRRFNDAASSVGRGVKTIATTGAKELSSLPGSLLSGGGDYLSQHPDKERQLVRGASDVFLGYPVRIADKLHEMQGHGSPMASTEEQDTQSSPDERLAGSIAAMAVPNPWGLAAKGGGAIAEAGLGRIPMMGTAAGAGMGVAKNLLAYEASAPLLSALSAENKGRRLEAAKETATDPLGLALSIATGAPIGAGKGYGQKLRDPKTLTGRTLADIEAAGGQIKPFGKPVHGGIYETPEMTGLQEGRAGMNELASNTEADLKDYGREKLAQQRADYHKQSEEILSEHRGTIQPVGSTRAMLDDMAKRATLSNGKVANKKLHSFVTDMQDLISNETDQPDLAHLKQTGDLRMTRRDGVPVEDLIKLKETANDAAEWGSPATRDNAPYRLIYHALGEDAAAVDPRIQALNKQYGQTMRELEDANDILYSRRKPDVADSAAKSKSAALKLGRVGDDGQAGTTDAAQIEKLGNIDPRYAESIRALRAKKAMERLRYGEPEVSTSFEKGQARAGKKAAHRMIGGAVGAAFGHGAVGKAVGTAAGYGAGAALDNPLALQLRLGLPAAESLGALSGVPLTLRLHMLANAAQRQDAQQEQR